MDTTLALDTENFIATPALSTDLKWGIRFDASGTVTLVLGMRNYGRGLYTSYFARLMAARLGLPFRRVRIYYSAIRPAVLQTPQPSCVQLHETDPGPIPRGVREVIEEICDRVIEKGRLAFAAKVGVNGADVGFDQRSARLFILDMNECTSILEIAEIARAAPPLATGRVNGIERRRKRNRNGAHYLQSTSNKTPPARVTPPREITLRPGRADRVKEACAEESGNE